MSIDILDVVFRMEREFRIEIHRQEIVKLAYRNQPPDITVGEFFEFVRPRAFSAGFVDEEMDANWIWPKFQSILSDATGLEPEEFQRDRWLFQELGIG